MNKLTFIAFFLLQEVISYRRRERKDGCEWCADWVCVRCTGNSCRGSRGCFSWAAEATDTAKSGFLERKVYEKSPREGLFCGIFVPLLPKEGLRPRIAGMMI